MKFPIDGLPATLAEVEELVTQAVGQKLAVDERLRQQPASTGEFGSLVIDVLTETSARYENALFELTKLRDTLRRAVG